MLKKVLIILSVMIISLMTVSCSGKRGVMDISKGEQKSDTYPAASQQGKQDDIVSEEPTATLKTDKTL